MHHPRRTSLTHPDPDNLVYCTIADVGYLPRVLVLHTSLSENSPNSSLLVFCMDELSEQLLAELRLGGVITVPIRELEANDPALPGVRDVRTPREYCWTTKPVAVSHAFKEMDVANVIAWIDADLMFFADPAPLFAEMDGASVMITPHRFAPGWESWEDWFGVYNSQMTVFRRDETGLAALDLWRARCLAHCSERQQLGHHGDQSHLQDWPERFDDVRVLRHPGAGLAPWNARQYRFQRRGGALEVEDQPVIFYHYSSLQLYRGMAGVRRLLMPDWRFQEAAGPRRLVWTTAPGYRLSDRERKLFWDPYLRRMSDALDRLGMIEPALERNLIRRETAALARAAIRRVVPQRLRRLREPDPGPVE